MSIGRICFLERSVKSYASNSSLFALGSYRTYSEYEIEIEICPNPEFIHIQIEVSIVLNSMHR
jgi:hypothetical protein